MSIIEKVSCQSRRNKEDLNEMNKTEFASNEGGFQKY